MYHKSTKVLLGWLDGWNIAAKTLVFLQFKSSHPANLVIPLYSYGSSLMVNKSADQLLTLDRYCLTLCWPDYSVRMSREPTWLGTTWAPSSSACSVQRVARTAWTGLHCPPTLVLTAHLRSSPCIASLNVVLRTILLVLQCVIIGCLPVVVLFTYKYSHLKVGGGVKPS